MKSRFYCPVQSSVLFSRECHVGFFFLKVEGQTSPVDSLFTRTHRGDHQSWPFQKKPISLVETDLCRDPSRVVIRCLSPAERKRKRERERKREGEMPHSALDVTRKHLSFSVVPPLPPSRDEPSNGARSKSSLSLGPGLCGRSTHSLASRRPKQIDRQIAFSSNRRHPPPPAISSSSPPILLRFSHEKKIFLSPPLSDCDERTEIRTGGGNSALSNLSCAQ